MLKMRKNQITRLFERRSNESGYALVLTLWVSAILACLLLTFSMRVRANLRASSYHLKETTAFYLARGAIYKVASELRVTDAMNDEEITGQIEGKKLGLWSIDPAEWSAEKIDEKPDTTDDFIHCDVSAEDAKFPLDKMTNAILANTAGISPVLAQSLADFIDEKKDDKETTLLFKEELL